MNAIRILLLGVVAGAAPAQDEGGRDRGEGPHAVLFVSWRRTAESGEIAGAAWQALEPHYGVLSRRRLKSFDGDPDEGRRYLTAHAGAGAVVALDAASARLARTVDPDRPVLRVGPGPDAHLDTRVDRRRLAELMRLLRPGARRVALFGAADETLPGLEVVRCREPAEARTADLAWIAEGATLDPGALRAVLAEASLPLVSTHEAQAGGDATMTVRPDPEGLGLRLAAQLLRWARADEPFGNESVARLRVTVDLAAAARSGAEVPLPLLARADLVRRAP